MKPFSKTILLLSILISFFSINAQDNKEGPMAVIVSPSDLEIIIGEWSGTITYLDYTSNQPFSMPANLKVKQGNNANRLSLYNLYPKEPKANNKEKVKLTKGGTHLNNAKVTSRVELPNGQILIITEKNGKDDNLKAIIRYTYTLGEDLFIMKKEVQFIDSKDWILRSEFNYFR